MSEEPISALIAKVEASTGPDRHLDHELWAYAQGIKLVEYSRQGPGERLVTEGKLRFPEWIGAPEVTASLDRAIGFVERTCDDEFFSDADFTLGEALEHMQTTGFRLDRPLVPQIARSLLFVHLTKLQEALATQFTKEAET